jgi:anti-sigma B factor antagonist
MAEQLSISVEQRPEALVLQVLAPNLDENNMNNVRAAVMKAAAQTTPLPLVVDLARVKYVPSLALGALVGLGNQVRAGGRRLILVSLQPTVRQVMAITRLDRVFEIMDDVPAALRSLGSLVTNLP